MVTPNQSVAIGAPTTSGATRQLKAIRPREMYLCPKGRTDDFTFMGHMRNRRYTRPADWEIRQFNELLGLEIANRHTRAEIDQLNWEMY